MSYHNSMLPLGQMASGEGGLGCTTCSKGTGSYELRGLGWIYDEAATYGLTDSDRIIPSKPLCGDPYAIQGALKDLGYYKGKIDGDLGKQSTAAMAAFSKENGVGNVSWPNVAFCTRLKDLQKALIEVEYEDRHPPKPVIDQNGNVTVPVQTGVDQKLPVQVAPPVEEDNTRTYVMIGGFVAAGLIALGLVVYASRDSGGAAYTANGRGWRLAVDDNKSPLLLVLAGFATLAVAYKIASSDDGEYTPNRRRGRKRRGARKARRERRKQYVGYSYKGQGMRPRRSHTVMSALRRLVDTGKSPAEVASIMKSKFAKDIREGTLTIRAKYE